MRRYKRAWRHYADFRGRSTRREFWGFALVHAGIVLILSAITLATLDSSGTLAIAAGTSLLAYLLISLIPSAAVGVRRLHDSGRTGWWLLLVFVPVIGWIILALFLSTNSRNLSGNPWGAQPSGW